MFIDFLAVQRTLPQHEKHTFTAAEIAHQQVLPLLQEGVTESGVSLLYTVRAMDAGPIIAQEKMHVDSAIQADSMLFHLFAAGTK